MPRWKQSDVTWPNISALTQRAATRLTDALTDGLRLASRAPLMVMSRFLRLGCRKRALWLTAGFFSLKKKQQKKKHCWQTRAAQTKRRQQLSHAEAGCKYGSVAVNPSQETDFTAAAVEQTESRRTLPAPPLLYFYWHLWLYLLY